MIKLEIAKRLIEKHFEDGNCGLFNCRNVVGDEMTILYDDGSLAVEICYPWSYFEVFGLTRLEFNELEDFYYKLKKGADHE